VVIPLPDLPKYIHKAQALFRSYYTFDEELVEHFKVRKTIKNYHGKFYLDRIIFDIDKGSNSNEQCVDDAQEFLGKLIETLENAKDGIDVQEYIQPWFSGRGFHFCIPNVFDFKSSNDLPEEVKATISRYFPKADNIYDGARLIRVGQTMNEKSNLYKVPLLIGEVMSGTPEEIHKIAEAPRLDFRPIPLLEPEPILEIFKPVKEKKEDTLVHELNPTAIATCIQKMYEQGDTQGSRHIRILRMSSYYMRHGFPIKASKLVLSQWAQSLDSSEVNRLVDDTYRQRYRYGCFDNVMDKYCDSKCIYYPMKQQRQDMLMPVMNAKDMEVKYLEKLRNVEEKHRINLADIYAMGDYWLNPGELIIVLGNTGMGKTAWVQNIAVDTDARILWLSLEMPADLMYRRFIQIAKGKSKKEVDEYYDSNENTWSKSIEHINCLTIPPKIEQIRRLVAEIEPAVLIIDTIDGIRVSKYIHDSMFKIDEIINEVREIATSQQIIVMGISHTTKGDSRMSELDEHSGKHSSSIAQKADTVIAVEGVRQSITRMIRSKKTRDGEPFSVKCNFFPETFRFIQEVH
tara:strand:+ start:7993 stop:9708 length:1716 start_codon:yes stop_codon:yes gene_type:complete